MEVVVLLVNVGLGLLDLLRLGLRHDVIVLDGAEEWDDLSSLVWVDLLGAGLEEVEGLASLFYI